MDVLERGGSAADAAAVALLVAGVVQPVSSGLGGGGFALYWDNAAQKSTLLDFRESAPFGIKDFEWTPKKHGPMVGVPGELAGIVEMHRRWGKLALGEHLRVAALLARDGFSLGRHMHRALRWNKSWVLGDEAARQVFSPTGTLAAHGDTVKNEALARTLELVASEGHESFYRGAIAQDIVAAVRSAGGHMVDSDLSGYAVIERPPLEVRWNDHRIVGAAPPSGGGLMTAEALAMHEPNELRSLEHQSGAYLHVLAESMRAALADHVRFVGDPAYLKIDPQKLLATERLRARRARISLDRTSRAEDLPLDERGTASFVAVDAAGNAVAVTTSLNDMFGARLMTNGFPLNDQLLNFTTEAQSLRYHANLRPNTPRAGARPGASLAPTIVLRGDRPVLVVAASGGWRIPGVVAQTVLGHLLFARPLARAANDLRIHTPPSGGLWLDPRAPPELVADLKRRGEVIVTLPDYSAVAAIAVRGAHPVEAVADPRKGGQSLLR